MDISPILQDLTPALRALPNLHCTTVKDLVDQVYGEPVHFGHEYYYENGYELDDADFESIGRGLLLVAARYGISLDASQYYERVIGLPKDADFIIRRLF